ncbi:MAG: inositol monophosphatase family protein [Wenzhouxiangellaceae bacterium]|nr:inositol monophosphatase family protein [Wenzhouxiangellaceae bacterium]
MTHAFVNTASEAARKAGDLMLKYRDRTDAIPVERKARGDYVSEIDRACEELIRTELKRRYPEHAIVGEEQGGKVGDAEHVWLVDPIDGTTNYLRGIPHYAVSIALLVRGRVEHGVILDPVRDELFTASRGDGAMLNNRRIRVSGREQLDGAIVGTALPFRSRRLLPAYMGMFNAITEKAEDIRRAGAASLDLAYVACGRLDGYWELALKPWDTAAGALLVQEAGGVVMDIAGGDQWLNSGHILAAPFKLITPLRKAIEPHLTEALRARLTGGH